MTYLDVCAIGIAAFFVVGLISAVVADRRAKRRDDEWERQLIVGTSQYAQELAEEARSRRALGEELAELSWPAVRALCERTTGKPCECSTKAYAAHTIWWTRARRGL